MTASVFGYTYNYVCLNWRDIALCVLKRLFLNFMLKVCRLFYRITARKQQQQQQQQIFLVTQNMQMLTEFHTQIFL
jgi:hypothetical protein